MKKIVCCLLLLAGFLVACHSLEEESPSPASRIADPASTGTPFGQFQQGIRPRRLQPGELVIAAETDDIPAIMAQDNFFTTTDTKEWLDDEYVIGLALEDQARAYPIRLLSNHELVNDSIGERQVLVSWCPLCFTAVVFDRMVEGRELTFGVSGMLFHDNLVMYDHQTNTLWSQLLGQSLRGAYRQKFLNVIPSILTTWGEWKELYPETLILSAELLGQYQDEVVDPYSSYYLSGAAGLGGSVTHSVELPAKILVIGVRVSGQQRAYPLPSLSDMTLVEDELGGVPLLLIFDATLQAVYLYRRDIDGRTFSFEIGDLPHTLRDKFTQSTWDWRSGLAISGELVDSQLTRYQGTLTFWFAWAGIFPETEVMLE
jgi:hypothetical protein